MMDIMCYDYLSTCGDDASNWKSMLIILITAQDLSLFTIICALTYRISTLFLLGPSYSLSLKLVIAKIWISCLLWNRMLTLLKTVGVTFIHLNTQHNHCIATMWVTSSLYIISPSNSSQILYHSLSIGCCKRYLLCTTLTNLIPASTWSWS